MPIPGALISLSTAQLVAISTYIANTYSSAGTIHILASGGVVIKIYGTTVRRYSDFADLLQETQREMNSLI